MKKNLLLLVALLLTTSVFAQKVELNQFRVGFASVYDTGMNNPGYALNGIYAVDEHWETEIAFTHIFKKKKRGNNVLDFNARYVFMHPADEWSVYALGGMGFNFLRVTDDGDDFYTDTRLGLNLGLGANYTIDDKLSLAPQLCYTISENSYYRIGVGIQYHF
ncbi:outer membrane beta-barrel protein [Mangrovibacterium marinum]|uniref:Outer membrane protein with beta-barrel domain n=1 Tax=Mangrovibacterium marinum TaxID=1639118 RepID=A0A2T5C6R4_9BACT|nr:outer membrane beta-barrel protein [Mangrovibacterium marinum]PTN10630.1 outer membrane protein with beta-barrel domain [Mangrovibacterium marinum]